MDKFENYAAQGEKLRERGYSGQEHIISIVRANVMALVTAGPFALVAAAVYFVCNRAVQFDFTVSGSLLFLALLIVSIVVHEALHGLFWSFFCPQGLKSVRFGVMWESLTPYCHCTEPLNMAGYLTGALAPFFILGWGISIAGIISGSVMLIALGATNLLAAGGDTTMAIMVVRSKGQVFLDHPDQCGFIAYSKADKT